MDNIRRELGEYIPFILHPPKYEKSESIGGEKEEHFPVIYIFFIAKIPPTFRNYVQLWGATTHLKNMNFHFIIFVSILTSICILAYYLIYFDPIVNLLILFLSLNLTLYLGILRGEVVLKIPSLKFYFQPLWS